MRKFIIKLSVVDYSVRPMNALSDILNATVTCLIFCFNPLSCWYFRDTGIVLIATLQKTYTSAIFPPH